MNFRLVFFCIILLPLQACTDFSVRVFGKVFDKETGLPLANANVNLLAGKDIKKTNSDGYFEVFSGTRPFQEPIILVSKEGYKPFYLEIDVSGGETNYTIKSESKSIDFEEPIYPDPNNRETFITGTWIDKWSKEFMTGDTLSIYLSKDNRMAEIEKIKKEVEKIK